MIGGSGSLTTIVTDELAEPPAPSAVNTNVYVSATWSVTTSEPFGPVLEPSQAPDAVSVVASVDVQESVTLSPVVIVVADAVRVTVGVWDDATVFLASAEGANAAAAITMANVATNAITSALVLSDNCFM